jgi:hypothetical protein
MGAKAAAHPQSWRCAQLLSFAQPPSCTCEQRVGETRHRGSQV